MTSDLPLSGRGSTWRIDERMLACVSIVLVGIRLLISMRSRFWLDETHTYWATNGGFGDLYSRCVAYPLSIAYTAIFCAIRELGAHQEWIFRVPSLAAFALSVWFLFGLSRRLFDTRVAWFTIAIFIQIAPVIYAATDARSYAIGLLFVIVSTDLLVRLVESPRGRVAAGYGATAGLVIHFHLLLGAILVVHLLYLGYVFANGRRIRVSYLAIAAMAFGVVASPIALQGLSAAQHASLHLFQPPPTLLELVQTLAPKRLAVVLLAALFLTLVITRKLGWKGRTWNGSHVALSALWMFVPPLLYFLIARVSNFEVFWARYLLSYSPGLALCFGVAIASVEPPLAGYLTLGLIIANSAMPLLSPAQLRHTYNRGDWGAALAFVEKETAGDHAPVFLRSQFIESDREEWRTVPLYDSFNFSPLTYYPAMAHWIPVQLTFTPRQAAYLDHYFDTDVRSARRFLFVSFTGPVSYLPYLEYFRSKVGASHVRHIGDFDYIDVFEFVK